MRPRLRLYVGDDEADRSVAGEVKVRLAELAPILADAVECNRPWLRELRNDEVSVSHELFDVFCEYWDLRPSA